MITKCFYTKSEADRFMADYAGEYELSYCDIERIPDYEGDARAYAKFSTASGQTECYRDMESRKVVAMWWCEEDDDIFGFEVHWEDEVNDFTLTRFDTLEQAKEYCDEWAAEKEPAEGRMYNDPVKMMRRYVLDLSTFDEINGADEVYSTDWFWSDLK